MAEVHPIAKLLTDEMRARVRAARFEDQADPEFLALVTAEIDGQRYCPLGVALRDENTRFPIEQDVLTALHLDNDPDARRAIDAFIRAVDFGDVCAADVYVMLGCEASDVDAGSAP